MTLLGAIQELNELRNDDDIPVYTKLCIADIINVMLNDVQEIKHGYWIDKGWNGDIQFQIDGRGNSWHEWECDKCGFISKGAKWNYCPNCGARMDGGENE